MDVHLRVGLPWDTLVSLKSSGILPQKAGITDLLDSAQFEHPVLSGKSTQYDYLGVGLR